MNNKGELLIESLLSLVIITIALIPIFFTINNIYSINNKVNLQSKHIINQKNLLEYLKSLEYKKIEKKVGNKKFKNIKEAFKYFNISTDNYYNLDKEISVSITKTNECFSLFKTEYIYKLKVGKYEDYYIP